MTGYSPITPLRVFPQFRYRPAVPPADIPAVEQDPLKSGVLPGPVPAQDRRPPLRRDRAAAPARFVLQAERIRRALLERPGSSRRLRGLAFRQARMYTAGELNHQAVISISVDFRAGDPVFRPVFRRPFRRPAGAGPER
jgi:hypothetical protein